MYGVGDMIFAPDPAAMTIAYSFYCRNRGNVCPCFQSDTSSVRIRCQCNQAANPDSNECPRGNYCYAEGGDGVCSATPKNRRLTGCAAPGPTPAPPAQPQPTQPPPAPTP